MEERKKISGEKGGREEMEGREGKGRGEKG